MSEHPAKGWIGASLLRKEDARHLLGLGPFVGDIRLPGMQDIAFLRSQVAHGVFKFVRKPDDAAARMFTAADLSWVKVLEAGPELANYGSSPYPALADGKVRYAGQTTPPASARTAPMPKTSQSRSTSTSISFPRSSTCARRCGRARPSCSTIGRTTRSFAPASTRAIRLLLNSPPSASRASSA